MKKVFVLAVALVLFPAVAPAQTYFCEEATRVDGEIVMSYCDGLAPIAPKFPDPLRDRLFRYTTLQLKHRVDGLASYYSGFFDGRKTANGEIFRNKRYSAAHLTLPLGCWIEVTSRATGKKLRMRVNDRGPYAKKFMLDLSQAAARFLGVDKHPDRYVSVRVIALPGEEPLPEMDERLALTSVAVR
ncbi:MAG TPA: septal ring lytic transglycosylase RlpA family protein [Thermoanaerobaculia bacterium]